MDKVRQSGTNSLLNWDSSQGQLHIHTQKMTGPPKDRIVITLRSDTLFKTIYQAYLLPGVMLESSIENNRLPS